MASSSYLDLERIAQSRRPVDITKPGFQHRGPREHREDKGIQSPVREAMFFFL